MSDPRIVSAAAESEDAQFEAGLRPRRLKDFTGQAKLKENIDRSVMMVTAEAESSLVMKALEAGANDYLMKPFTREALIEKLDLIGVEHA